MMPRKHHVTTAMASLLLLAMLGTLGCQSIQMPKARMTGPQGETRLGHLPSWQGSGELDQQEILPDTHVSAGRLHETHGRLARAVEQYRLAIGQDANHTEAHNRLGIVLDQLGRFKEADESFLRAIELAPDQAYLHNNLGFSYVMQTRWPEAETQFRKAIELDPLFMRARVNLGMVLAQQDKYTEALAEFERVLAPADAQYNLGLMYQSKRRLPEAAQAFKMALVLDPQMVAARRRLESLPANVVASSETTTVHTASPVSASPVEVGMTDDQSRRPTALPAGHAYSEEAPAAGVSEISAPPSSPPANEEQADESPASDEPVAEAPTSHERTAAAPEPETSSAEVSATDAPAAQAPVADEPATDAPTVDESTLDEPEPDSVAEADDEYRAFLPACVSLPSEADERLDSASEEWLLADVFDLGDTQLESEFVGPPYDPAYDPFNVDFWPDGSWRPVEPGLLTALIESVTTPVYAWLHELETSIPSDAVVSSPEPAAPVMVTADRTRQPSHSARPAR